MVSLEGMVVRYMFTTNAALGCGFFQAIRYGLARGLYANEAGYVDLVWTWGDLMNPLQIFPNPIGVLALSGIVATIADERGAASPSSR
jgi:Na+/alanine symporter